MKEIVENKSKKSNKNGYSKIWIRKISYNKSSSDSSKYMIEVTMVTNQSARMLGLKSLVFERVDILNLRMYG